MINLYLSLIVGLNWSDCWDAK